MLVVVLFLCIGFGLFCQFFSPGQYLVFVLIVYSFILDIKKPFYLDKKGKYCGNSFSQWLLEVLDIWEWSAHMIAFKREDGLAHCLRW